MQVVKDHATGKWVIPSFSTKILYSPERMLMILAKHHLADSVPVELLVQVLGNGREMPAMVAASHPSCPAGPRNVWFKKNLRRRLEEVKKGATVLRLRELRRQRQERREE